MTSRLTPPRRLAAVCAASTLAALSMAPAASAVDGDVDVVNTETIQVYTDAAGGVQTKRVYEQLALTGNGSVELRNPIETDGLRNLDGFGGYDLEDGEQVTSTTVSGKKRLRSVSNYDGDLPLEVEVRYLLDGEEVEPGDVVGADGTLEVSYRVTNVTATSQEVSFDDGKGGTVTKTVQVPIPMVGSLTTVAPPSFTEVESKQANMAGDGKGGTKLSFTMTLFPPLGSDTAEFGYTAHISDGVVPRAEISALPVNPLQSPTFASAATSYQGGADTGVQLAEGATTIDENLLKLRDGASDLLAGLIRLRDGSSELQVGLAGTAVPGARRLADGMGQLDDGIGQLSDGSNQLSDGADKAADGGRLLRDGAGRLSDGLDELGGGAVELDDGAGQLLAGQKSLRDGLRLLESGVQALPESVKAELGQNASYQGLLQGLQSVADGIGNPDDVTNPTTGQPATLFGGLNAIAAGIPASKAKLTCASLILADLAGTATAPLSCGVPMSPLPDVLSGNADVQELQQGLLGTLSGQLSDSKDSLTAMSTAINQMKAGLYNAGANPFCSAGAATPDNPADDCGMLQAVRFFKVAIPLLVDGITANIKDTLLAGISVPTAGCDPAEPTLLCGAGQLVDGTSQLKDGTAKLRAGSGDLGAGGDLIYDKLGELAAGLTEISDGAGRLADGAGKAQDGSRQLADGSTQLADGLADAADGSRQITEGLGQAADGAPKLVDGAQRLSDEGTKELVSAGEDTAQSYGEMYATITAGADRAQTESMAYGAPEGAMGLTAYSYVIQGEDGEGGRNLTRGLAGLAVLGAGIGVLALRRGLV